MKFNGKSLAVTISLLVVALIVALVEISIFISGPSRKYEADIKKQEQVIQTKYKDIKNLERNAFYYITYVGEDNDNYVWFNEKGVAIQNREKTTLKTEEVKTKIANDYQGKDITITLGYGYNNPVYVAKSDKGMVLLDYDTLEEVYFLKDGEA